MTIDLPSLVAAARTLSPQDQLELVQTLVDDLHVRGQVMAANTLFWQPATLEELVTTQTASAIHDITTLPEDIWPDDESVDDFMRFLDAQRQADRAHKP